MKYTYAQAGYSVECGAGSLVELGTCGDFSSLADGAFSIVCDIKFKDKNENYFFGGTGTGTNALYLARNVSSSNDDSLTFNCVDDSGDQRTVKWAGAVAQYDWNNLIFTSSGSGAGTLKLFVNGVEKNITSQTNDVGFSVTENYELSFGEVNAAKIGKFSFSSTYFYNRVLTAAEIEQVNLGAYPSDYIKAFPLNFPNRGLNEAL